MNFLNFKIILIDGMYILDVQAKCKVRFDFTTIDSSYYIGGQYDPLIILTDIEKKYQVTSKNLSIKKTKVLQKYLQNISLVMMMWIFQSKRRGLF
jgi:hypothetical protein